MEWVSVYDESQSEDSVSAAADSGLMDSLDYDLKRVADELEPEKYDPEPEEPEPWQRHRGWHEMPQRLARVS